MSLSIDGFWKSGFWSETFWADGFWFEGTPIQTAPSAGNIDWLRRKKRGLTVAELIARMHREEAEEKLRLDRIKEGQRLTALELEAVAIAETRRWITHAEAISVIRQSEAELGLQEAEEILDRARNEYDRRLRLLLLTIAVS